MTQDVDGVTCLEWLSIDGVTVGWIDMGGDARFGLAVWRKKGDLISCALVVSSSGIGGAVCISDDGGITEAGLV